MYNYQAFVSFNLEKFCLGRTKGKVNQSEFTNSKHPGWEFFNYETKTWEQFADNCWEKSLRKIVKIAHETNKPFYFSFFNHNYSSNY